MAELNQQQVVDYIKGISVLELSQLVKTLEKELGVSAAAAPPPPPAIGMPIGTAAAALTPSSASSFFTSCESSRTLMFLM
jgi:large subunit ribosomal protein L7/L12